MRVNGKTLATTTTVNGVAIEQAGTLDGVEVAPNVVPISAPLLFTANDCLDIGTALGSPVSLEYHDKVPFTFNGHIEEVRVQYLTAGVHAPRLEKGAAAAAAQAG
jgi:hypothetical protein